VSDDKLAKQRKIYEIMAKYKVKMEGGGLPYPGWVHGPMLMAQMHVEIMAVINWTPESTGDVIGVVKGDVDNAEIVAALKRGGIEVVEQDEEGGVS